MMRLMVRCALLVILALGAGARAGSITVQVDKPGVKINPMLYGIFFEEINHAGDGGLWAELIRNPNFEDGKLDPTTGAWDGKLDPWTSEGDGQISIKSSQPFSKTNPHYLCIQVQNSGGAANSGFWGISVEQGESYKLSFVARAEGFNGALRAALQSGDGSVTYAQADTDAVGPDWKRLAVTLKSVGSDPAARLVITAGARGTICIDRISLVPADTFKGHGLRKDLAEMLAGLKPGFVRFPGGCWVEGETLEDSYRWKRTIGDPGDRWNQWNRWGYFSPNGLGYHEYLQMCEDLGAQPLFVINCGMSHKGNVPMEKMDEFVQDALDAIEYANGPADSKWGALRAKAGHPAPFDLKYIEIGNENGGPAYAERYVLFYDAIRKAYPQVNIITDWWRRSAPDSRPLHIIDEHYYNVPEFFIENAGRYDRYDRSGPKVYVGEYAVTKPPQVGTLRGAIGEAAFMTGMERNSDVVVMSSYAPLLTHVNDRRWKPDLINFDGSRAYGIPSYYVQKLFAENRGDVVLPATVDVTPEALPVPPSTQPSRPARERAPQCLVFVSATRAVATGEVILKIVNAGRNEQQVQVDLQGVKQVGKTAAVTVLTGDPQAENTLDDPTKVAPQTRTVDVSSPKFPCTLPGNSVTVIRLSAK